MKYCEIRNGAIFKYNVDKPKVVVGESTSTFLPLEDIQPTYNPELQRIGGTEYVIDVDKVRKVYTVVDIPLTELEAKKVERATQAVDALIQAEIDLYNTTNGVQFKDIDAIAKYVLVPTYAHYDFCKSMVDWVAVLWEAARTSTATDEATFLAGLPTRV